MNARDELWLHLTRVLPARRADVWGAVTEPEQLARWWGPKGFTLPGVEFDPRVGASYRIAMQPPEGELFHLHGAFREVDPPSALAYTFIWEPADPDDRETLVTLSLTERDQETQLELTQGEFATEERLSLHEDGWTESFEKLAALLD
jgi:uncharacterized protein YndB with AHSA1/START domain